MRGPIAGFWIRLLAQIIDLCLWGFLASVLGVALALLAPDRLGLANALPESTSCKDLPAPPPGIRPPAGFSPNRIEHCSSSFFGIEFRNAVILTEQQGEGTITRERSLTYAVDRDLRRIDVFDLDTLLWLGFLAYVVAAQALSGATLGKRALGLRVVRYSQPPGWRAAAVRNLVLDAPILLVYALVPATRFIGVWTLLAISAALALCNLAIGIEVWLTARKGKPSIHDRIAGTRVVRLAPATEEAVA